MFELTSQKTQTRLISGVSKGIPPVTRVFPSQSVGKVKSVCWYDNLQRAKDGTHMFDAKYRYVFVV